MKKHSWIMYLSGAILLGALAWLVHTRVHFQWSVFRDQLQHVDWRRIVFGAALVTFLLLAARVALGSADQAAKESDLGFTLLGSQVIGFTAVALFGRLADLVRPYLVSQRTKLALSSQIAVYTVERMFDLGAMAIIFSSALLLAPDRATLPHHEALQHTALGGLALTIALAIFAISVRASGRVDRQPGRKVARLALTRAGRIGRGQDSRLSRRSRFHRHPGRVLQCSGYFADHVGPHYSGLSRNHPGFRALAGTICDDLGALPGPDGGEYGWVGGAITGIGWFTQIGVTTGVMQKVFNVQFEPALACGTMLLIVTFMCVIPVGLIWARVEHVSLKKISEQVGTPRS